MKSLVDWWPPLVRQTYLCEFFFFIMFADTPECPETQTLTFSFWFNAQFTTRTQRLRICQRHSFTMFVQFLLIKQLLKSLHLLMESGDVEVTGSVFGSGETDAGEERPNMFLSPQTNTISIFGVCCVCNSPPSARGRGAAGLLNGVFIHPPVGGSQPGRQSRLNASRCVCVCVCVCVEGGWGWREGAGGRRGGKGGGGWGERGCTRN